MSYRNILERAARDLSTLPAEPQGYGASLTMPSPGFTPGVPTRLNLLARLRGEPLSTPQEEQAPWRFAEMMTGFAGTATPGSGQAARGIRAYHGSPHRFDRFDLSRIGTGEGAQAYGHGLYFAQGEDVARGYRDRLRFPRVNQPRNVQEQVLDDLNYYQGNIEAARGAYQHMVARGGPEAQAVGRAKLGVLDNVAAANPGSMYEVNLRVDPSRLLDWDAPLSAQPQAVRDGVRNAAAAYRQSYTGRARLPTTEDVLAGRWDNLVGEDGLAAAGGFAPGATGARATEFLRNAGIPGLQYLDAGSRTAGQGTRNYVMFDDSLIDILRRYGIAGLGVGLGGVAAQQ